MSFHIPSIQFRSRGVQEGVELRDIRNQYVMRSIGIIGVIECNGDTRSERRPERRTPSRKHTTTFQHDKYDDNTDDT